VPRPNVTPTQLPAFDTVLPSLRLLPIDYPDYNAIDSIDSQNVTRFGLRNKIQTKRDGKVVNLAYWDVYTDWRLRPDANQTTFADVYSDLVLKPRRWLTVESLTRHDIDAGSFPMSLTTATIEPNDRFAWTVGQFYLRQDTSTLPTSTGEGQNLFLNSLLYRLNENWAFRATHHFDARTGRMQEQYYSIYRDFRSWTGALTVRLREGIGQPDDFTVGFTFSLKAFPKYGVGRDAPRPYYLLGS
jgi:LPS-assembly protein